MLSKMQETARILVSNAQKWYAGKTEQIWMAGAKEIKGIFIKFLRNDPAAKRYANLDNLQYLLQLMDHSKGLRPFWPRTRSKTRPTMRIKALSVRPIGRWRRPRRAS